MRPHPISILLNCRRLCNDACFDGAPIIALIDTTFHDLVDVRYQKDVDTVRRCRRSPYTKSR
jgi:hypothetical protein